MPTTYTPLATTTAAGGETTISFTGIDSSYTDLVLVSNLIATTPYEMFLQFNTDTGANYSTTYMEGNGSTASSGRSTNSNSGILVSYNSTTQPTPVTINIQNYASTSVNKSVLARSSAASASILAYVGLWRNTAAINSIQLKLTGGRSFSAGATFSLYGVASVAIISGGAKATGGDRITTDGTYWYHTFYSSGTFTPTQALTADYLVVAGGGGTLGDRAGGGGAGGLRCTVGATGGGGSLESPLSLTSQAYTVTIGAGGTGRSNGSNSVFSTITSTGGGAGGYVTQIGSNGGSGGGGGGQSTPSGGTGTANQGYAGGTGAELGAAGGGGSGAIGSNGSTNASGTGGNGGNGVTTSISGASTTYAGGGGGYGNGVKGNGGTGGGGNGAQASSSLAPTNATPNTGSGAGGGYGSQSANGGSGVVIVRYAV